MSKKKILENFLFKADEEGLDYAIQNYSSDLENINYKLGKLKDNYLSARKHFLNHLWEVASDIDEDCKDILRELL